MSYTRRQATQDEIDMYRDKVREQFKGFPFRIDSNGYGLRVECNICHSSATLNPEMWMRSHADNHFEVPTVTYK